MKRTTLIPFASLPKTIAVALLVLLVSSIVSVALTRSTVSAANKRDWVAENIISDADFTNKNSMSRTQIQAFLNKEIGNCDMWGTGKAVEFGSNQTRAQFAKSRGWPAPPYVCLNKYVEVPKKTPTKGNPINNFNKTASKPKGAKSAAWIIKDAANRYNISPKVLLVKVATESAGPLTRDKWPLASQYQFAMGANCPDSGPGGSANCDDSYSGFSIQMYSAAALMRSYLDNMDQPWWSLKRPGKGVRGSNYVGWNVAPTGCGGTNLTIKNKATAALYTYTPYQPNAAALNNMYGTGNRCSAYGNRNFWRVYVDWFGSSRAGIDFIALKNPRELRLKKSVYKTNLRTGKPSGAVVPRGTEAYFPTRYTYKGELYVRSQSDTNKNIDRGIRYADVKEVLGIKPIKVARELRLTKAVPKTNFRTGEADGVVLPNRMEIYFTSRYTYNGELYVRTQSDTQKNLERGIRYADVKEVLGIKPIKVARELRLTRSIPKTNFRTGKPDGVTLQNRMKMQFASRYTYQDELYVRTESDTLQNLERGIRYADLVEVLNFKPIHKSRYLRLKSATPKTNLHTGADDGVVLKRGMKIYFTTRYTYKGELYVRTQSDTDKNLDRGIRYADLVEVR